MAETTVAVYDRFYTEGEARYDTPDIVSAALDPERHKVIAYAHEIGTAAMQLVRMRQQEIPSPDIMIVGGTLDSDHLYPSQPVTMTEMTTVPGRNFLGQRTMKTRPITTTLLPVPDKTGAIILPTSKREGLDPNVIAAYYGSRSGRISGGGAAYIIAHLARQMLPENEIKIIGVSAWTPMLNLPIDAFVKRDSRGAVEKLRQAIS